MITAAIENELRRQGLPVATAEQAAASRALAARHTAWCDAQRAAREGRTPTVSAPVAAVVQAATPIKPTLTAQVQAAPIASHAPEPQHAPANPDDVRAERILATRFGEASTSIPSGPTNEAADDARAAQILAHRFGETPDTARSLEPRTPAEAHDDAVAQRILDNRFGARKAG